MGALSLVVVLAALSLAVAWLAAWPILGLWRLLTAAPQRLRLARFNIVVLVAPFLLGAVVALGAVWPAESVAWAAWDCHCAPLSIRGLHLCLAHPEASLPLLPLATFLLIWFGWRPARVMASVVHHLLGTRALLVGARGRKHDKAVRLAELGTPNAFTVGLFRPVVVADRNWWVSLSPDEQRVVAEHEWAHVRCRDPLSHTMAHLLAGLAPRRVGRPLVVAWLSWAERRADESAARAIGDPFWVAEFLLRQVRLARGFSLVPAFRGGNLEARIVALLEGTALPPRLSSDIGVSLPLSALLAALLMGLCGFQIHNLVEYLLHLFS